MGHGRAERSEPDLVAAEHRAVIEKAEAALLPILKELVGPVWFEVPQRIRDLVKATGLDPKSDFPPDF